MQREDREVVIPLMDRLAEVAEALASGQEVDPDYLATALRAWHEYIAELHQQRLGWLAAIVSAAPAPHVGRRRRGHSLTPGGVWDRLLDRSRTAPPEAASSIGAAYTDVAGTQARMDQRIRALEGLLEHYRHREYYADQMIASLLRSGAFSDRAWARYEEEFVLRTLDEHLPEDGERRLESDVAASRTTLEHLRAAVQEFLTRPITVREPNPRTSPTASPKRGTTVA